MKVQWTVDLER